MHMRKPLHITFDAVPWCDKISIPVCTRTPGGKHVFCDPRTWVRKECLHPWHQLLLIMQQQGRGMANQSVLLWSRSSRNQFGKHHYIMLWDAWVVQPVLSDVYKSPTSTPKFGKGNTALQVSWSSPWEPTRVIWFTKMSGNGNRWHSEKGWRPKALTHILVIMSSPGLSSNSTKFTWKLGNKSHYKLWFSFLLIVAVFRKQQAIFFL